jgi:hypothetical protein
VHDAFHSTGFEIARNMVLFLALVFWLGLAFWVFRDARRRVDDPWLVGTATLLALVAPYVGAVVYLLFRPPEILDDVRARDLELRALEERLVRRTPHCPVCRAEVEPGYLVCPVCTTRLRQPCASCSAPLEPLWQTCPYCATPVGGTLTQLEPPAEDLEAQLTAEAAASGKAAARARPARAPKKAKAKTGARGSEPSRPRGR